jgi:hypothetical protein|tara:strand:- start:367 stop:744 length:378 start_codon:yes stop_codon:yes gene_type:complete
MAPPPLITLEILGINDNKQILSSWRDLKSLQNFNVTYSSNPLESISKIHSQHYDIFMIDLGESSVRKRPYAIAHMIRDMKPGVLLIGVTGCPIIEYDKEPFDEVFIEGKYLDERIQEILPKYGFK